MIFSRFKKDSLNILHGVPRFKPYEEGTSDQLSYANFFQAHYRNFG